MAMSEPNCGTDVMAMETRAVREGDFYRLNGRKMWITNGTLDDQKTPADVVWLYARTDDGKSGKPRLSTFLVDRSLKGYSVGQKIMEKLGMRRSPVDDFEDSTVPEGDALRPHVLYRIGNPAIR